MLIESERLRLVPFELPLLLAAQAGDLAAVGDALGAVIPPGWPSDGVRDYQFPSQLSALGKGVALKWLGRLIVTTAEPTLAGVINLKGGPDAHGRVELGYEIVESQRRKGYATEAARALLDWCFAQPEVKAVRARTLPDNKVSAHMLERLGFKRLGPQRDTNLGEMIVWELTPSSPSVKS
ncbi:MAG: GNAT family N-acetyltransferase [Planctomycetes bacterium]|nr:GNAT family N-acetyltransferase [Planctomycetota bacterium]MCB9935149.1 GNAT family N-acetyltransferase [Planctomycetota bacterium]